MTVQDLILILENYDSSLVVVTTTDEEDYFTDITTDQINVVPEPNRPRRPQLYTANTGGENVVVIKAVG